MSNSSRPRADGLTEIAGLWERTSSNGNDYIGGNTPDDQEIVIPPNSFVMVFPNDNSDNPRAPAFRLLLAPPKDQQDTPPPKQRSSSNFLSRRETPPAGQRRESAAPSTPATTQHPLHNPDEPGPPDGA